ncbi:MULTISPECIES: hypothetical protein [unclassified Methylobacterium]|uniref:hypothetical protein n=1 Tax=unclassified Methylobacterium TaxID=2615210 RepID=UPI000CC836FB|nr:MULTISPECIES: hypothetical protein [unclassified Methylobacterium]PIU05062.1 MAG: hypothetical protein COT56_16440 [Methylobacterium sp. CG09_land_8_20_14_0_10_71_15]PIU11852.1 MAG: hypothetical protein COT28_17795 [Methylobacterium sp. CG08_land_8_20_14_0_20_71_15]GBU19019.1 hypothetical protein AwMethylo_32340 [Methylobacterium sp.]
MSHREFEPLGGGPSEAIAAMRRATERTVDRPAGNGGRGYAPPEGISTPSTRGYQNVPLVEFTYTPDLLKTGYQTPDGQQALYAGLVYRRYMKERRVGWNYSDPTSLPFAVNPADSYTGKLTREGMAPHGELPHSIVPAGSAV